MPEPGVVVEPAEVARTAHDRLSYSRNREHVLAIESAKTADTRVRPIEKAPAMLRDQERQRPVRAAPSLEQRRLPPGRVVLCVTPHG
jgi:hypothetical protein